MTQGKAKIVLMGVVRVQLAKKNIKVQIKQVKIKEISMFFHLKPWQSWQVIAYSYI
jgi:hypothetical protein